MKCPENELFLIVWLRALTSPQAGRGRKVSYGTPPWCSSGAIDCSSKTIPIRSLLLPLTELTMKKPPRKKEAPGGFDCSSFFRGTNQYPVFHFLFLCPDLKIGRGVQRLLTLEGCLSVFILRGEFRSCILRGESFLPPSASSQGGVCEAHRPRSGYHPRQGIPSRFCRDIVPAEGPRTSSRCLSGRGQGEGELFLYCSSETIPTPDTIDLRTLTPGGGAEAPAENGGSEGKSILPNRHSFRVFCTLSNFNSEALQ